MTAIANGWCSSELVPKPIASGSNAVIAPKAVINFGRNLVEIEYTSEWGTSWVSLKVSRNCKKVKMAFSLMIPTIMIIPV